MSKGISETFDDHEQDTAKRGVSQEIVERARRTTKMQKVDLDAIRTESGTRLIVPPSEIEQHARSRTQSASPPDEDTARETMPGASPWEPDPHSRPTIEAVAFHATHVRTSLIDPPGLSVASSPEATAPLASSFTSPAVSEQPTPALPSSGEAHPTPSPSTHMTIPRRLLAAIVIGTMFLIAAAGAFGFALGRRPHR